jgi:molecular chaperone GrpE
VLARLRRSMKELRIERIETQGQPFDANIMNAIGTIESSEYPSGHVAEQFSPGYRWQGQVLSFADVCVAN